MSFVYRSLDSGLGALDLTTLVEASRSRGAGGVARSSTALRRHPSDAHANPTGVVVTLRNW